MKGFIELTIYSSGKKLLQSVNSIVSVIEGNESGTAFVETDGYKGKSFGYVVAESYDEVKRKLADCKLYASFDIPISSFREPFEGRGTSGNDNQERVEK